MNLKELQLILEEGEGYKIEFKESPSGIDKEMVAFANASGGKIFLGISDDKKITGVKIDNEIKSQIQDIANNCEPSIKIFFEEFENILIINIREGNDKPYKCSSGFYTRLGPNSQKLKRNEIIEFIKSESKVKFDELINLKFDFKRHFDTQKLDKYLKLSGISKIMDNQTILINLNVAEKQEGKIIFNNTGILFFAKNLQEFYPHTAITCALYKGTEKVDVLDRRDFNEDIIFNINSAMNFLKQHIPVRYKMTGSLQRQEIPEIPYDALREAIINAVAHRDYFEKGSNVMVEMFDDRVEITNFGGLPRSLNPKDFGKKSVLRNPNIANLLHRINYIEKMGTGISKIRRLVKEAGLPPVKFVFNTFFTTVFKRLVKKDKIDLKNESLNGGVFGGVFGGVKKELAIRLSKIIFIINRLKQSNVTELVDELEIPRRTMERDMNILKEKRLVQFTGAPKTGGYVLTKKGKVLIKRLRKLVK